MRITDFDKAEESNLTSEELSTIYKRLFNSADGKIILEDLSQICGILRSNLTGKTDKDIFFYIASHLRNDKKLPQESAVNDVINF